MLGTERVTRNKFHSEDPQILGATLQNSVCPLEKNIIAFELYITCTHICNVLVWFYFATLCSYIQ
jgi:hypothetical protein